MTISLRLEDKMNRQLSCVIEDGEGAAALTDELVRYGFISQVSLVLGDHWQMFVFFMKNFSCIYRSNTHTSLSKFLDI